jgi:hypothetical protein
MILNSRTPASRIKRGAGGEGEEPRAQRGFRFALCSYLRAPEAYGTNQSPPLIPAEPENTEQPTCNSRGLGNDRATYQDIIDNVLVIDAV